MINDKYQIHNCFMKINLHYIKNPLLYFLHTILVSLVRQSKSMKGGQHQFTNYVKCFKFTCLYR